MFPETAGAVRIMGRPGQDRCGVYCVYGNRDSCIEMAYGKKKAKKTNKAVFAAVVLITAVLIGLLFFLPVRLRGLNFSVWM